MTQVLVILASAGAAFAGTMGGLGGAVLLVPILVLAGWSPIDAAPIGLMVVIAGSVAAGPRQLEERTVNHRLGIVTEIAASAGAIAGALALSRLPGNFTEYLLASLALAAAILGHRRIGLRNPPDPRLRPDDLGERIGSLSGAYPLSEKVAPYRVTRLPVGMILLSAVGFVAGATGTSGGFLRTPVLSEMMHVPTRVAAATTTFAVGMTASAAFTVLALEHVISVKDISLAVVGSFIGGVAGARAQSHLAPRAIRRILSYILIGVAIALVASL